MGLATEMARAVLRIVFEQHRLGNVMANIHPRNTGSRRVAARVGFHYEGNMTWDSKPQMRYRIERPCVAQPIPAVILEWATEPAYKRPALSGGNSVKARQLHDTLFWQVLRNAL